MEAPDAGAGRSDEPRRRVPVAAATRRQFLIGGTVAAVGASGAIGLDHALDRSGSGADPAASCADRAPRDAEASPLHGDRVVAFHGRHQAGIATDAQAHATFIGLDLRPDVDRAGLRRMMRILTDDAARLTRGAAALADSEPDLATWPARLTVTFGVGPGFVTRAGATAPGWLGPLPPFTIDRLQPEWNDGDLLLQVAGDDPITVAHTIRMLVKDARSFARIRWMQQGFRNAHGTVAPGTTMRNLFGQVDGTTNPTPGTDTFDRLVWATDGWLAGGTGVVIRRTAMDLDTWDRLDRGGREQSVGRRLDTGAPLTGHAEHDEPDFAATTSIGFPVIAEFSHMRRARSDNPDEQISRRSYNYDAAPSGEAVSNSGLIFVSYQANVGTQFVPIQRRLDELDLLNEWTTPIGSAVFAIPPGCAEDGYIGETLLE